MQLTTLSQSSLQDYVDCAKRFQLRYLAPGGLSKISFFSRPMRPHPLFAGLIKAAKERNGKK